MGYSTGELLMVSLLGFTIVFIVLFVLSLITTLMGRIVMSMEGKKKTAADPAAAAQTVKAAMPAEDETGELIAVLQCVLSQESGISPDEMLITSIEEVKG